MKGNLQANSRKKKKKKKKNQFKRKKKSRDRFSSLFSFYPNWRFLFRVFFFPLLLLLTIARSSSLSRISLWSTQLRKWPLFLSTKIFPPSLYNFSFLELLDFPENVCNWPERHGSNFKKKRWTALYAWLQRLRRKEFGNPFFSFPKKKKKQSTKDRKEQRRNKATFPLCIRVSCGEDCKTETARREKLKAMTRLDSSKLVSLCVQEMQFWWEIWRRKIKK